MERASLPLNRRSRSSRCWHRVHWGLCSLIVTWLRTYEGLKRIRCRTIGTRKLRIYHPTTFLYSINTFAVVASKHVERNSS